MADLRTSTGTYDPLNMTTGSYGSGADPFATGQPASKLTGSAAASNLAASPDLAKLSQLINSLNQSAQQAANAGRLGPQGQQIQSNLLGNLTQQSAGLLDPQTEQMLQQGIAQQGGAAGFGVDSGNLAASYRRALGQTIEGTETNAQKQYTDLLAANPSAPIFDVGSQLTTPSTYASVADAQAQRQLEQEQIAQKDYEFQQQQQAQQAALQAKTGVGMGLNEQGQLVKGGQYGFGYTDLLGRFHGGTTGMGGVGGL